MTALGLGWRALLALAPLIFLAGIIDALAGGGGLITVPAYLAVGLDPRLVLGTNKLTAAVGTTAASANYMRRQRVAYRSLFGAIAVGIAAGTAGSLLSQRLSAASLRWVMLILLPAAAVFVYSHHDFGLRDDSPSLSEAERARRACLFSLPIGVYDGFFGPGTGTFFAVAFSRFCRYDLLGATARAKTMNLATNLAALAAFLWGGRVQWRLGLTMALAGLAGNFVGSHLGLKHGPRLLRPAIFLVLAALLAKLALDAFR